MSKINRALFNLLRAKVAEKYPTPRHNWDDQYKWQEEQIRKAVKRATKEQLIEVVVKEHRCNIYSVLGENEPEYPGPKDEHKDTRAELLRRIDAAELKFLAGDSEEAMRLIDEVCK